ncbi:MAG TPA: hypothetical protein ENI87_09650 [bacterium]|nr:hypothetical protein [bacterium]
MNRTLSTVVLSAVVCAALPAQNQATTLTRLARDADVVVRATVLGNAAVPPGWQRVTLRRQQLLKGQTGSEFTLAEPGGRCCGRSLFALQPGDDLLLFLKRIGPTLHLFGDSRAVLPATPALLQHSAQLIAAPSNNAIVDLLVPSLEHIEPRIADDAAMALASLPHVTLSAGQRTVVAACLQQAVQRGATRTAALADVAARLGDADMADTLVPIYLHADRDDQARLLRRALRRFPPQLLADRLPVHVATGRTANLRAARLLVELPPANALAAMTQLLQRPNHPSVQLHLCEGLLAAGVQAAALRPLVPSVVIELAERHRARRPVFRNIDPSR